MKTNKKELVRDLQKVYYDKRELLISIFLLFAMNVVLFITPIINLDASHPKIRTRFTDNIYDNITQLSPWYYLLSFSVLAIILGIGHNLIAIRIANKQGKDLAHVFLVISMIVTAFAICFLFKILEMS